MRSDSGVTVGELVKLLSGFPPNTPVCFGAAGHWTFNRVKDRGGVIQIDFMEDPGTHYKLLPEHETFHKDLFGEQ